MEREQHRPRPTLTTRRAFLVAFALTAGPAVTLGFGRFGYTLVLPVMRADLSWSFATAGSMNTANSLGYLIGALITARLVARWGERRTFLAGILLASLAMLASAASGAVAVLLVLRLLVGIGGAVCFVSGGGLAARIGLGMPRRRSSGLLGVYFSGAAVGIVLSGPCVPLLLDWTGWRGAWLLLGGAGLLGVLAAGWASRAVGPGTEPSQGGGGRFRTPGLAGLTVSYGCFGAGYIAYMTFVVAYLRQAGAGDGQVAVFWTVLGASGMVASLGFGILAGVLTGGRGAALVLGVLATGSALPLLSVHPAVAYGSAVVFGASFLSVITVVTVAAQRLLPPQLWTAAIARLTIAFATGQCLGPLLAGALSDSASGVRAGLALGTGFLVAGLLVALTVRPRAAPARS